MKFTPQSPLVMSCLFFTIITLFSCSKDSDLMADYVALDPDIGTIAKFVANDTYQVSINSNPEDDTFEIIVNSGSGGSDNGTSGGTDNSGSGGTTVNDSYQISSSVSIVLDVLANDTFKNLENVSIIETSQPVNGSVAINSDNTLTYTPSAIESSENTFTYTVEFANEDGTIGTETGTVTVNINPPSSLKLSGTNIFYVTVDGNSSNDGSTEATSWDIKHAFSAAKAGDVVYIKAGNYGASSLSITNSGAAGNPIIFLGYSNTPGDIIASGGSTFSNGDTVSASIMPLLDAPAGSPNTGINISANWIELHNFQIKDFIYGVIVNTGSDDVTLNNVITQDSGDQTTDAAGTGIRSINNVRTTITNCFVKNAGSIGIHMYNSSNSLIDYCNVFADNPLNPGGYYIMLTAGTNNTIIDHCTIERTEGLAHGGHGYILKWKAYDNIVRNSTAIYTNVELNYEDVTGNLLENMRLIGQGASGSYWHTNVDIRNGANNNTLRNFHLTDVYTAVQFIDFDDGYTPNPDTDVENCGYSNILENFLIERCLTVLLANGNENIGGVNTAPFTNNTFDGWVVNEFGTLSWVTQPNSGNKFINSTFSNGTGGPTGGQGWTNNIIYANSNSFNNVAFPIPPNN